MNEIKLNMRYPESRLEDVTDAYMRGFEVGLAMRAYENAKLRELLRDTIPYVDCHIGSDECVHLHECHGGNGCVFERLAHELGVDV